MIQLDIQTELENFAEAFEQAAKHKSSRIGQYVVTKGKQIVLGNNNPRFGATFPGLHERLFKLAPAEGEASLGRLAALGITPRGQDRPVVVRDSAKIEAERLLGLDSSGVFQVISSSRGGVQSIRRTKVFVKGKRAGKRAISKRAKTAVPLQSTRSLLHGSEVILNRKALGIAFELKRREQSRGSLAAAFLPKRYRKLRVGKGSTGKRIKVLIQNKQGGVLGGYDFMQNTTGAMLSITGNLAGHALPSVRQAVAAVLRDVATDTRTYVLRSEAKHIRNLLNRALRGVPKAVV